MNYYIFNNQQKIIWSGIYGNDGIDVIGLSEVTYLEKANSIDSVDYEEVYVKQSQWASGVLLKSIWSKKLYSDVNIYVNNFHHIFDVNSVFTQKNFDSDGGIGLILCKELVEKKWRNYLG